MYDHDSKLAWGVDDTEMFLARLAGTSKCDAVICEDYTLYGHLAVQQTGSHFVAVQVIGALKMWAYMRHTYLILQPASLKTSLTDDEMARLCGLNLRTALRGVVKSPHARDALRHMFIYLLRSGEHECAVEVARKVR